MARRSAKDRSGALPTRRRERCLARRHKRHRFGRHSGEQTERAVSCAAERSARRPSGRPELHGPLASHRCRYRRASRRVGRERFGENLVELGGLIGSQYRSHGERVADRVFLQPNHGAMKALDGPLSFGAVDVAACNCCCEVAIGSSHFRLHLLTLGPEGTLDSINFSELIRRQIKPFVQQRIKVRSRVDLVKAILDAEPACQRGSNDRERKHSKKCANWQCGHGCFPNSRVEGAISSPESSNRGLLADCRLAAAVIPTAADPKMATATTAACQDASTLLVWREMRRTEARCQRSRSSLSSATLESLAISLFRSSSIT